MPGSGSFSNVTRRPQPPHEKRRSARWTERRRSTFDYMLRIKASPNSLHFTFVAPSMSRAKS
jgi:hypothetical protein